jgi:hypothetical protein
MRASTIPGQWNQARIIEVLSLKITLAAMAGRSSPIAARVLSKLESL